MAPRDTVRPLTEPIPLINMTKTVKYLLSAISIILSLIVIYLFLNVSIYQKHAYHISSADKEYLQSCKSLIYSADNNAPPLRFVDPFDGQYKGVVVDYLNVLSLKLGVNIIVRPQVWEKALDTLKSGKSDLCDMFQSEERAKHFLFTDPIYILRGVIVTTGDNRPISQLHFATQRGDYLNEWLLENYPEVQVSRVDDISSAIDLLLSGAVDAVAGDEPVVLYQLKSKEISSILEIREKPLYEKAVAFAIPKDKPQLLSILNKGIASIAKSGQLESIQQKWFGISTPIVQLPDNSQRLKLILICSSLLSLAVIAMTVWNYSLKKEVEKRTTEVINSKNDLQITFDGINESIILFDTHLNVININMAMVQDLNQEKSLLIGQRYDQVFSKFNLQGLTQIIEQVRDEEVSIETELNSGSSYYIVKVYPLQDTLEKLTKILVITENISQEKISERQLAQASKMAAIGQLAAGMGHEIRNPLGIIRNHSYILRQINDQSIIKSLDYIDGAVNRAGRIIDNLLEFSRFTSDKIECVNIYRLVRQLIELENKTFMKHNIDCSLTCEENLMFHSNMDSIKHILINIFSNAIDAIDENGLIEVTCSLGVAGLTIRIEDTGEGIEEDQIEQIFNPFYTTKQPDKGTGLGLYIVYNEVKKLGGEVNVYRSKANHTVFEIQLPDGKEMI